MDGWTDRGMDGCEQKVITIAHPEDSSGELKKNPAYSSFPPFRHPTTHNSNTLSPKETIYMYRKSQTLHSSKCIRNKNHHLVTREC